MDLKLRLLEQALGLGEFLRDPVSHLVELAIPPRPWAISLTETRQGGEGAQRGGKPLLSAVTGPYRPEKVLENAEHHEAESDADQAVARHRELGHRSPALQD